MRAPVLSPCKFFSVIRNLFRPLHVVRYRIRIPVGVSSRFIFLCEPYFWRACVLDARVRVGLAKYEGALRGNNNNNNNDSGEPGVPALPKMPQPRLPGGGARRSTDEFEQRSTQSSAQSCRNSCLPS